MNSTTTLPTGHTTAPTTPPRPSTVWPAVALVLAVAAAGLAARWALTLDPTETAELAPPAITTHTQV